MKLLKKLLGFIPRVFDKSPAEFLALRLTYSGAGMTWRVDNGVLTTQVVGGLGAGLSVDLRSYTVSSLVGFLAAQPGYSVLYADNSENAQLSAAVLLDSAGDINTSNGDHLYGYTSWLYTYLEAQAIELAAAEVQIGEMLDQLSTKTAAGEWLDELGSYYAVPRIPDANIIVPAVTNHLRNNTMAGTVAGTPGTAPSYWATTALSGLTRQVVGFGVENGIHYVDLRYSGTATGTQLLQFEANTTVASAAGEAWTASAYIALVAGSLTNVTSVRLGMREALADGTFIQDTWASVFAPTAGALSGKRVSHTQPATAQTTARVAPRFAVIVAGAVDFTLRIGMPQLEKGTAMTAVIATSNAAATRPAVTGPESDAQYGPRIIPEVLRPRGNGIAIESAIKAYTGQPISVVDVVIYGAATPKYNGGYTHDATQVHNANPTPIYGLFDVLYSYDLLSGTDVSSFREQIRSLLNRLRDAGTQLRALTLQGSTIADSAPGAPSEASANQALNVAYAVTDAGPAPAAEQMGVLASRLVALTDTAAKASADDLTLTFTAGFTYSALRSYDGAITHSSGSTSENL